MDIITPPPQSRSPLSQWLLPLAAFILSFAIVAAMYVVQEGGYLQTRILTNEVATNTSQLGPGEEMAVDSYTHIEAYCQQIKEMHINECGYYQPEDDFLCRTKEASQKYQDCMETTTIEDIPFINQEGEIIYE